MTSTSPGIEFRNVRKRYSEGPDMPDGSDVQWAVKGISFTVERGTLTTILGPSGCGKTTTLRMIAGLETPTGGQVLIDGKDVTTLAPAERNVSMVFQSYALFPHMTVLGNVMYGLRMSGQPAVDARARAVEALINVGLPGYEDRLPSELSGGQQQRVALARALVLQPAVLLFDEPLSNLDARLRREMRDEIRQLQQRLGLTVAYVTHDQNEALAVSDRIIVMDHGVIAQMGTPQELYERPATKFVAGFMGEAMLFPGRLNAGREVQMGPLRFDMRGDAQEGPVTVAVRPEAWQVGPPGSGLGARLAKCVLSADVGHALQPGADVGLSLADHGVCVVGAG
jgi:iron(III) transport system ATP-binding protein